MFVNSANYSTYTLELVQFCDFNKYVIRVETDPTDPTGVYRQEDNIVDVPDNEVTVSVYEFFLKFIFRGFFEVP